MNIKEKLDHDRVIACLGMDSVGNLNTLSSRFFCGSHKNLQFSPLRFSNLAASVCTSKVAVDLEVPLVADLQTSSCAKVTVDDLNHYF